MNASASLMLKPNGDAAKGPEHSGASEVWEEENALDGQRHDFYDY